MTVLTGRRQGLLWAGTAIAFGIAATAFVLHARGYFFLYDDFALLRQSADTGLTAIATTPLFGFYRPLPFLLTRAQFAAFGWDHPAAYAAGAILLHLANAGLVGLLARRLGIQRDAAVVAAALFALSAPAAESYFWLSGVFDRLSVTGVLAALLAGDACVSAAGWRGTIAWGGLGLVAAAAALLSKETAVVLPVLVLATLTISCRRGNAARIAAYVAVISIVVAGDLVWRQRVLPALSGAYGGWPTLVSQADIAGNAGSYVLALVRLPLPGREASWIVRQASGAAPMLLAAGWVVVCARLGLRRPLLLAAGIVAAAVSIAPVIWTAATPGTSASGRFLYLSGVWLALLPAAALDVDKSRAPDAPRIVSIAVAVAVALAVVCQTASVVYQARVWTTAATLSRQTIDWMQPYRTLDRSLFIANFPAVFVEGPYVLKDYAFASYFGPGFKPRIRVRKMALRLIDGRSWFAGWMDQETALPGERTVTLRLPIKQPTPDPRMEVLSPAPGARVKEPFILSGWSVDTAGPLGCGVDLVHVYARSSERPPAFVGVAAFGLTSPSPARMFGARYASCGWSLKVSGLPGGSYVLTMHPFDNLVADFGPPASIALTIVEGPG